MGVKAGLDPAHHARRDQCRHRPQHRDRGQVSGRVVLPRTFDFGFATGLMCKDVQLCLEEGKALGVPMAVLDAVHQLFELAMRGKRHRTPTSPPSCSRSSAAPASRSRRRTRFRPQSKRMPSTGGRRQRRMSDDIHEVYAIRYGHHDRAARPRTSSAAIRTTCSHAARLFRLGDRRPGAAPSSSIPASTRRSARGAGGDCCIRCARAWPRSASIRTSRATSSSATCTTTTAATTRCSPTRATTCRTARWRTPPAAACATPLYASVRGGLRRRHGAQSVPGRVAFHDGARRDRAGRHGASHRRPLEGPAMRAREDEARHVVLASDATHLYAHMDEGRVFPTTYNVGEVLEGYATLRSSRPRGAHRAGPRSAGAGAVSGGASRASRAGWCGSMSSRKPERHSIACTLPPPGVVAVATSRWRARTAARRCTSRSAAGRCCRSR